MSLMDKLKFANYRIYLLVRRALCSQSIHDHEASHLADDGKSVHLECFYCGKGRQSWWIQR